VRSGFGELELATSLDGDGTVHVILDVTGWFE
jgi:hypothetical protein